MQSIHNVLPPIVDTHTRVLVVGSMPGVQSLEKQQYYGNARNHFWPLIGEVFQEEVPDHYERRIAILQKYEVGLWDVIQSCEREGSLDATIRNEVPNDFDWLFTTYPQIELVLFNGGKAFEVFKKQVGLQKLAGRAYEKMPSTSPIPGKNIKSFEQKVSDWQVMKQR